MSPLGIVAAGAGGAVGILVAGPLVGVVAAVAAWFTRVAVAVPRNPRSDHIEPYTLDEPWSGFVQRAIRARQRFAVAVRKTKRGPLHDRLGQISHRVDAGVSECWRVAQRGQELTRARVQLDVDAAHRAIEELHEEEGGSPREGTSASATERALQAQLATADRMDHVILDAHDRLRLTGARLDEAVARVIELSTHGGDVAELRGVGADVDGLVDELEALHRSLAELDRA